MHSLMPYFPSSRAVNVAAAALFRFSSKVTLLLAWLGSDSNLFASFAAVLPWLVSVYSLNRALRVHMPCLSHSLEVQFPLRILLFISFRFFVGVSAGSGHLSQIALFAGLFRLKEMHLFFAEHLGLSLWLPKYGPLSTFSGVFFYLFGSFHFERTIATYLPSFPYVEPCWSS